jgi:hypothetical protein
MGYDRHGCVAAMKRAGVCESTRHAWLAESVPSSMAESCTSLAVAHVTVDRRPSVWRVGSLFAGARDALSAGSWTLAAQSSWHSRRAAYASRTAQRVHECWGIQLALPCCGRACGFATMRSCVTRARQHRRSYRPCVSVGRVWVWFWCGKGVGVVLVW